MTYDDDFVRLNLVVGAKVVTLKQVGLEWPPPEVITVLNGVDFSTPPLLTRYRMSEITDEERGRMTNVCRGAEYFYADQMPDG